MSITFCSPVSRASEHVDAVHRQRRRLQQIDLAEALAAVVGHPVRITRRDHLVVVAVVIAVEADALLESSRQRDRLERRAGLDGIGHVVDVSR